MYGNPEVTTGGRALKFYASMRIDVRKTEQIKAPGNEFVGSRTRAKIVKNKMAPPFREAEFDIMYGKGISKESELLDIAVELDIIHRSGAWFSYGDQRIGQGRDNARQYILNNPDFAKEVEEKVRMSDAFKPKKAGAGAAKTKVQDDDDDILAPNNGKLPKIKIDIAAD